ncbi:MAG: HAD family hydrolase [Acidobacteriota bacterium]
MISVESFDVFDTVLTRAVGSPEAVFLVLGRRLAQQSLIACSPEVFARARIQAEARAHKSAGDRCNLEMIYAELCLGLGLSADRQHDLMTQECAVEAAVLRVVPGAVDSVNRARDLGRRVIFVSDMYLSADFIRELLKYHGLWRDGDRCYVSCEVGKSKRSGALFAEILHQEGITGDAAIHHGNDVQGDIRSAQSAGLAVSPFLQANPNRYEQLLEAQAWVTEGKSSVMAGASRLARLTVPLASPRDAALCEVAAGVAAPTLTGFALWLLQRAQALGLARLYFISRDGQVLLDVARRLIRSMGLSIQACYLYGSRQAWNLAATVDGSEEELAWIWDSTDFLSVTSLLNRIGIEPEQLHQPLESAGLFRSEWDRALRPAERLALEKIVATDGVRGMVLEQARSKREVLLKYLKQGGLFDGTPWGLVDLGWYGSMQNALAAILADRGIQPPVGFYFALYKGDIVDRCSLEREAYYFDERRGMGYLDAVPSLIALMEMFCVADHGTVVDFVDQGERVAPLLKANVNAPVIEWGLPLVRETIGCFVDNLVTDSQFVDPYGDVRAAITAVLRSFWLYPSRAEATTWGAFPWEDGLGFQTYWNRLAQPYGWSDLFQAFYKMRVAFHHRSSWFEGSLALSPPAIRIALLGLKRALSAYRSWRFRLKARMAKMLCLLMHRL